MTPTTQTSESSSNLSQWWGRHSLPSNRAHFWQIGPMKLWIERTAYRIGLEWSYGSDWLDAHVREISGQESPENRPLKTQKLSCAFERQTGSDLIFAPALPDRPLILRNPQGLLVLPGDEIRFFLVSPLWLRIELPEPTRLIGEVPFYRLSDTWFGPMSPLGTLSYSSLSELYHSLNETPRRAHCVTTALTIRNRSHSAYRVDRMQIPFPKLSLFYSSHSGFWTDRVTFERGHDEQVDLHLDRQPPVDASPTQFISGPRDPVTEAHGFKALRIFERGTQG